MTLRALRCSALGLMVTTVVLVSCKTGAPSRMVKVGKVGEITVHNSGTADIDRATVVFNETGAHYRFGIVGAGKRKSIVFAVDRDRPRLPTDLRIEFAATDRNGELRSAQLEMPSTEDFGDGDRLVVEVAGDHVAKVGFESD